MMEAIQQHYLQTLSESKTLVSIYLQNGIQLKGIIDEFDQFSIVLKSELIDREAPVEQMVYKHAIATIVPIATKSVS